MTSRSLRIVRKNRQLGSDGPLGNSDVKFQSELKLNIRHWITKVSLTNPSFSTGQLNERDYARFEFKINFGRIFYIAHPTPHPCFLPDQPPTKVTCQLPHALGWQPQTHCYCDPLRHDRLDSLAVLLTWYMSLGDSFSLICIFAPTSPRNYPARMRARLTNRECLAGVSCPWELEERFNIMKVSWVGHIFCITGPLWGESRNHRRICSTKRLVIHVEGVGISLVHVNLHQLFNK